MVISFRHLSLPEGEGKARGFGTRIRLSMLAPSSWLARPARTAAAMARVRPAAPRTSASGLARFLRRVSTQTVGGVAAQSHVCGVGAPGEVALVTDHGVLGAGPPQPRDHTVGELVGEKMSGDGPAPCWSGQACGPERPVSRRGHPADPDPAQIVGAPIAFRFEAGYDFWVVEPGPPAALRNADGLRLTDQDELLGPSRGECPGEPVQR